jgi:RNA polymerase sigma-70 factor, ECF subfamily
MEFEEIYKTYWQKIFRLCMGYVNNYDWAKDITQETFITVWQQLPKFRSGSLISTWVFRIACNHCLRQLERENRIPKSDLMPDVEDVPVTGVEGKMEFLYKCIAELAETDRIIISLELEDIKQTEIANIVGISEVNVRVRIHRIKEKLTQKFERYDK